MSIGVEKVNGGIIGGQWTEGALTFFKIDAVANAFDGSYALTPTKKGPRPAPNSAAELVYRVLATRGTPVILEIVDRNEIHCALAYGTRDELLAGQTALATELQAALRALGPTSNGLNVPVSRFNNAGTVTANTDVLAAGVVDFSALTVTKVDFELA